MSANSNLAMANEIIVKSTNKSLEANVVSSKTPSPQRQTSQSSTEDNRQAQSSGDQEEIVDIENVTVKFRLKGNQTIAQIYPNCMTLAEVKTDIARRFEIEPELLVLKQGQDLLSDFCAIRETDSDEYGIHEYQLELNCKLKSLKPQQQTNENDGSESERQPKLDLNVYYRYDIS